jgi:hypothetical protein
MEELPYLGAHHSPKSFEAKMAQAKEMVAPTPLKKIDTSGTKIEFKSNSCLDPNWAGIWV